MAEPEQKTDDVKAGWLASMHGHVLADMRSSAPRWLLSKGDWVKVHAVAFFTVVGGVGCSIAFELANLLTGTLLPMLKSQLNGPDIKSILFFAAVGGIARAVQLAYVKGHPTAVVPYPADTPIIQPPANPPYSPPDVR